MARVRASTSAHQEGRAMDFRAPSFGSPREIALRIAESPLQFDQLILEGSWVHYGIAKQGHQPRRQVLTAVFRPGRPTTYVPGVF
jgi:hypothetical protein